VRITVDIDDVVMRELMRITGSRTKSAAVARAAEEYVRRIKAKELGRLIREGAFDYPAISLNEEGADSGNPVPPLA
jgi:Arc/MetJ family transcription regulator